MSMHQLSVELKKILEKPAFEKSQLLFPNDTYVNTVEFRLRFLRCELFDAKKAALRLVKFLDFVHEIFDGNELLRRPIKITDLSKAEMKIMRLGIYQLLPYRDRSGRPVYAELGDMGFMLDLKMRMRIRIYMFYIAGDDIESQRKGLVILGWIEGDFTNTPMPLHQKNRRLTKHLLAAIPIRSVVYHICMPDTLYFRLLRSFLYSIAPRSSLCRFKCHTVKGIERRYRLKGFGIPVEMIPITDTGNIKRTYLYQWIKVRKIIESKDNLNDLEGGSIILLPASKDVLIRTGTTTISHPGNEYFRGMIERKHNDFRSGSEFTLSFLAQDIVEEIERLEGRFLKWDSRGFWTELTDRSQIIFKVEISIRDFKVRSKAKMNLQTNDSSTTSFKLEDGRKGKRKKVPGTFSEEASDSCDCVIRTDCFRHNF